MKTDPQGRQFIAAHDVRGAIVTAAASLTTGTATSLLAGDADHFLDLIEVTFANNSTVSASVALTNDGTSIRTFQVPASNTLAVNFEAPLNQNTKNTPWLADMEDITATTVSVGARFIRKQQ